MRTRRKVIRPIKKMTRKYFMTTNVTRKRVQNTRKKGGSAFTEKTPKKTSKNIRLIQGVSINIQPWSTPTIITQPGRVEDILSKAGGDFTPPRHGVIDIFQFRPEQNLHDAISAVNYIKEIKDSADEEDRFLYKIIFSFSVESEHREWLNNRGLDYQSLRQLLKLIDHDIDHDIDDIPDFKFPLVLTKFYQFFVLHKEKGPERERGLQLFKAAAKRILRNAITMAKGLSKGPITTAPMVLYRGLNITLEQYLENEMNDSYQRGFSSTSLNEGSSRQFVRGGFMMRIHVPERTPISCYGLHGEFEIPLPIGCKFVVRRDKDGFPMGTVDPDGILYIDFDLVPSDGPDGGGGGGGGIAEIERKYEELSQKIDGLREGQLTEVFRRSYPEYSGPGSNWRTEESSQSSSQGSQSQLNHYFENSHPSQSQGLINMVEEHRKKSARVESPSAESYHDSVDLSKHDESLLTILNASLFKGNGSNLSENGS